jgi:mono/diheme cytochrome c family protein
MTRTTKIFFAFAAFCMMATLAHAAPFHYNVDARTGERPYELDEDLTPEEKERVRNIVVNARNEGIFTPPAYNRDQIAVPGENGGANQGSTAADPSTGVMYVKTYDEPTIHRLTETVPSHRLSTTRESDEQRGYALYMQNCVACHGPNRARIPFQARTAAPMKQHTIGGEGADFDVRVTQGEPAVERVALAVDGGVVVLE